MQNEFYSDFDFETLAPQTERRAQGRTPFEQDRDRIIYTSSFRRLQAKTQVFLAGEYDFYRTRLTHSLEVAQIGRSICAHLMRNSPHLGERFFIDADLVEAVCLAHDLGHPPFGHAGERTLNQVAAPFGGFEGNAQTVRLLCDTIYSDDSGRTGMNPTRAFLDGVLKYKSLFSDLIADGAAAPENHFVYDDQKLYLDFVFGGSDWRRELPAGTARNGFRSIECVIMDWADDTAYSLNDIVDSVNAGFIRIESVRGWAKEQDLNDAERILVDDLVQAIEAGNIGRRFSRKIGDFIQACELVPRSNIMDGRTNRYAFGLRVEDSVAKEAKLYKRLAFDVVFRSPQIQQLEHKGDRLIKQIFEAFAGTYVSNPERGAALLPARTDRAIRREPSEEKRARLVCDYIAGMTDHFAVRTYKRLFDPDVGSIIDLV